MQHVVDVEVVLTVAMIAVARHTIDIDYRSAEPQLIGIAALVLALTGGYYLYRQSGIASLAGRITAPATRRRG